MPLWDTIGAVQKVLSRKKTRDIPDRSLAVDHKLCCIFLPLFVLITISGFAFMLQ